MSAILRMWGPRQHGALILDEVDLVMHPLRSELNFPLGERRGLLRIQFRQHQVGRHHAVHAGGDGGLEGWQFDLLEPFAAVDRARWMLGGDSQYRVSRHAV